MTSVLIRPSTHVPALTNILSIVPKDVSIARLPRGDDSPVSLMETPSEEAASIPVTTLEAPWDRLSLIVTKPHIPMNWNAEGELTDVLPDQAASPLPLITRLVIHAVEVLLCHRPATQLRHWLTPDVYQALSRRAGLAYRIKGPAPRTTAPVVRRLQYCRPQARVVEAAIVIYDGSKTRAAAIRMEYRRSRWLTTALEIG